MSPAEVIVDVFGGIRSAARAINVDPSTVLRWCKRADGTSKAGWIPHEYMQPLLKAAQGQKLRLTVEEVVWGRPRIARQIVSFALDIEPTRKLSALGHMAQALTA